MGGTLLSAIVSGGQAVRDGDQELAATLHERIQASLAILTPQTQPVTITLDDRSSPTGDLFPST